MENGILRKNGYAWWYDVRVVDNYIFEFIKNKFPKSLILPEFDQIDWFVIDENLPIEIQSTITHLRVTGSRDNSPLHSEFENKIRRQLEQNIINYDKCWFFFDTDYLKYLQNDLFKNASINLDWFYKFIKDEKLKVFTCSYDGKIEEKSCKDFNFILKFSSTCRLSEEQDSRILQRNKAKIANNVFKYYEITTEEMIELRIKFNKRDNNEINDGDLRRWLLRKERNEREKMIGNIYTSLVSLDIINIGFGCKIVNVSDVSPYFNYLGLTEKLYGNNQNVIKRFIDKHNISQYFPEYIRNKEKWDYLKESNMKINVRQFAAILTGKVNPLDWKKLKNNGW